MFEVGDIVKVVYPRVRDDPSIIGTVGVIYATNGTSHRCGIMVPETGKKYCWWDIENVEVLERVRSRIEKYDAVDSHREF